ncbi:T9SS type A sorting domain-containing protein [candidate division WOR-3 bacterium]|nr:T9SS type A sorting domain-containing protein [candidate division WOR-3 bacterium]
MINEWSISYCAWEWIGDSLYASDYHFDDLEHASGIISLRRGYSFSQTSYSDFLIFKYEYKNKSEYVYNMVYLGLYADINVSNMTHMDDLCGYVDSLGLAYFYDQNLPSNFIGVKILNEVPDTGVNFYWPEDMPYEDNYYYWLLSNPSAPGFIPDTAGSYAVMLTAGPYTLAYLDSITIHYGIAAGTDLEELIENTVVMQALFDSSFSQVEEVNPLPPENTFSIEPNPSFGDISIYFPSDVFLCPEIEIFDLSGRSVFVYKRSDIPREQNQIALNLSSLIPGTYLVKLSADGYKEVKKITLIK